MEHSYPRRWAAAVAMAGAALMDMIDITVDDRPAARRGARSRGDRNRLHRRSSLQIATGLFIAAAVVSLGLPRSAVSEQEAGAAA